MSEDNIEYENPNILEPTKEERMKGKTGYEGSQNRMYDNELSFLEGSLIQHQDEKNNYDQLFNQTHNSVYSIMSQHCQMAITQTIQTIDQLKRSISSEVASVNSGDLQNV